MPERGESSFLEDINKDPSDIRKRGHEEIRSQRRATLETRKNKILERQQQLGLLITKFYETVYQNPSGDHSELLWNLAQKNVDQFGPLSEQDSNNLVDALGEYDQKHKKAMEYYRKYESNPQELFRLCFGREPIGKIHLIAGPMTLAFRCFDEEDYIYAYTNYKHEDESLKHAADEKEKARRSQGVAFAEVRVKDLAGMVIMEKASNNCERRQTFDRHEIALEKNVPKKIKFSELNSREPLQWTVNGEDRFQFSFSKDYKTGEPTVNLHDKKTTRSYTYFAGRPAQDRVELVGDRLKSKEYVDLKFDGSAITFLDHTRQQNILAYKIPTGEKLIVKDEGLSKSIRRHEEQHQFNKLFTPSEHFYGTTEKNIRLSMQVIKSLGETLAKPKNEEERAETKRKIIEMLARHYRRIYIDNRARDEIIAYYKEGRELKNVEKILKTSPLYDYPSDEVTLTDNTKSTYGSWIKQAVYKDVGFGKETNAISYESTAQTRLITRKTVRTRVTVPIEPSIKEAEFNAPEVSQIVADTLKTDYQKFIDNGIAQIKALEALGYKRQEIVAFCNMLPARMWPAFVRRLQKTPRSNTKEQ